MSGNSTRLTLLIRMCGDPMWDLLCVQLPGGEPTDMDDAPAPAH